jgi:hypothetical protein
MSRGSSSTSSLMPRVRVPRHVARLITPLVIDYFAYTTRPGASARCADRRAARRRQLLLVQAHRRLLRLRRASGCLVTSHGSSRRSSSTTSPTPRILVPQHVARLVTRLVVDYSVHHDFILRPHWLYSSHAVCRDYLPRVSTGSTSPTPRVRVPRHVARLVVDYLAYAVRPGASAPRTAHRTARRAARRRLLRLHLASRCLGTSCGSSSITSPTPRVRVPRHVAQLVTRLVVDYFDYAAHPGASAHRAARHAARRAARRQLLRLRRASGCLGTSRGSLSTSSPTLRVRVPRHIARLVVNFFAYAARPGASARRAAHHAISHRLLRVHHASGCLGTLCGSSRRSSSTTSSCAGSSSTTSPTPRVRVPRHVARLVSPLVVDYFTYAVHLSASARRAARHAARCRLLRAP